MLPTIHGISFRSDTMGNRGAFITLNGKDMEPNFTSYEAVVSFFTVFSTSWVL